MNKAITTMLDIYNLKGALRERVVVALERELAALDCGNDDLERLQHLDIAAIIRANCFPSASEIKNRHYR
jgi:hypothetical protein